MADGKGELRSRFFGEVGNKLNTIVSNRSLVVSNQQLRVQLAVAAANVTRLQDENMELRRQMAELEQASEEERIEMIVRKRLQQRVLHLKSIANRMVQYVTKATADFEGVANLLDYSMNLDDDISCAGEYGSRASSSATKTGSEATGRRTQKSPVLEAVAEDVFGEMDDEDQYNGRPSDCRPIRPMSENMFKQYFQLSNSARKSHRNSRRETFFVKVEPNDSGNDAESSFIVFSVPEEDQVPSDKAEKTEDGSSIATTPVCMLPESLMPTTPSVKCSRKAQIKHRVSKSASQIRTGRKRRSSIHSTPKRPRRSSWSNVKMEVTSDSMPQSTPSTSNTSQSTSSTITATITSTSSAMNESGRGRRRAAAAKITSFKEPSLRKKMRNPNTH